MKRNPVKCDPDEVAIKSFFLGPKAENRQWLNVVLRDIFSRWFDWRSAYTGQDGVSISKIDQSTTQFIARQRRTHAVIQNILKRFEDEIPKFSPRYIGHMFSEISMPALLGHIATLLHNPNNISPEASTVGTQIESEAIRELANILGFQNSYGHFTSGGTVANFEFLFRARERLALWLASGLASGQNDIIRSSHMGWDTFAGQSTNISKSDQEKYYFLDDPFAARERIHEKCGYRFDGPILIVPRSKHYSWPKAMHYLGLGESNIRYIDLDNGGRASARSLARIIEQAVVNRQPILGVVGIVGSTELGSLDPIHEFAEELDKWKKSDGLDIWFHVDAAYGGFFRSLIADSFQLGTLEKRSRDALAAMKLAQSVTLDPHKLGYVPYASGAFVCAEKKNYFLRGFTGPYIVSEEGNVGNFTLEGSRSATGAVATYVSLKSFGPAMGYSRVLARTLNVKKLLESKLRNLPYSIYIPEGLDTNIICFVPIGSVQRLSELNDKTLQIYETFQRQKKYWISKTVLDIKAYGELLSDFCVQNKIQNDCDKIILLRLTLMNPFFMAKVNKTDHAQLFCDQLTRIYFKVYRK